jgi:hypothetical protein
MFQQGYELFIKLYLLVGFRKCDPTDPEKIPKNILGEYLRYLDLWTFRKEYGRNNKNLENQLNYNLKI